MTQTIRIALVAALLAVAGCLPESEQPLAPPDLGGGDARLLGAWLHVSEDGYGIYHAFKTDRADWDLVVASHDVEGIGEIETYTGHTSRLDGVDYLNVLVTGSEEGYLFLRYEFIDSDHVRITFFETDALVEAVRSGKLPGKLIEESSGPDVRITANSKEWRDYLAQAPSGLFGENFELQRVGPALLAE